MDGSPWRVLTRRGPLQEGMANHSSILAARTPWTVWKGKKIWHQKVSSPWSEGVQCAIGEGQRAITNSSRKNEEAGPKQEWLSVTGVSGGESKVQCYKEEYCIGTWNVRSMDQGKLEVIKQEMARVNIDILGISKLRWTGMGELNSDDHYIYYCGQESPRRNGVAIIVNKSVWVQYLDAISKMTEWSLFISKANHSISH